MPAERSIHDYLYVEHGLRTLSTQIAAIPSELLSFQRYVNATSIPVCAGFPMFSSH